MGYKLNIVRGAINHKRIVYVILGVLILLGIYGLTVMNKDEFPVFEIKMGLVAGVYPGASAAEVEEQLTKPLEDILFSFPEVNRETTVSYSKDGMCYIYVDISAPVEKKNEVWAKIKLKLNASRLMLPKEVLAVAVLDDFSAISSMLIAIESDDKGYTEMQEYADDLATKLRTIPTLANVSIIGSQSEEIAVRIDLEKLSSYGISPSSLMLNYQTSGMKIPGGTFNTGYTNAPIYVSSHLASESEIADHIVYSDAMGHVVRLRDIATIERRYRKASSKVDYNGNQALIISIEMRPQNNIVDFGKEVDKVLEEFQAELPQSVVVSRVTDQPKVVGSSVLSFLRDLVISMAVVIVVMLLLFPLRSALIAGSGVPVCTTVALAVMFLSGIDLNTVTLASLIVVLGMIVDDAVITMDGYMEHLGKGMSRVEAAVASANELFMPMFMATAAISFMFFPACAVITGYLGDFVSFFPWVIAIALAISLAYAVLVVPSLEVKYIKSAEPGKENMVARAQKWLFAVLQGGYDRVLAVCFKHPKWTLCGGVGVVLLGVFFFLQLNIQMMPTAARDYFAIEVYLEANSDLSKTERVVSVMQQKLMEDDRVTSVTSFIGTGAPRFTATYAPIVPGANVAQMIVNTKSVYATEAVLREYQSRYTDYFPEASLRFKQMDYQGVPAPVEIELRGGTYQEMQPWADSIRAFMAGMPELQWVHADNDDFVTAVDINLDADEAMRLGINKSMLSLYTSGAFNGQTLAQIWEDGRSVDVRLYNQLVSDTMTYEVFGNQIVPTMLPGVSVPLRQIADIYPYVTPSQYARRAGRASIAVAADLRMGHSHPEVVKPIKRYVDDVVRPQLPEGVEVNYGGLSAINASVIPEISLAFVCAVSVLFLFMLFHFKKASLACLTLVLSALCLFGAFFGLWIFGLDFGLTSVLGLISLVGIIVRNGIIMFEYAEELRFQHGMEVREAAMLAGRRRMRPIFLTSCTTALGVLPMIISADALWLPMGVVICFGTLLSVLLIVLIMPVSYWQIFKGSREKKCNRINEL